MSVAHACGLSRINAMSGTAGAYSRVRAAAVLLLSFCIASCVSLYTEENIPTLQTTGEPEWSEGLPVPPSGEVSFSFKPTQSSQFIHLDLDASHSLRQVQVVDQNNRVILETNFMPSAPSSAQARGGEAVRANTVSSSIVHSIPITGLDARMTYSVRVLLQMTDSGESGTLRAAISDELKPPVDTGKSGSDTTVLSMDKPEYVTLKADDSRQFSFTSGTAEHQFTIMYTVGTMHIRGGDVSSSIAVQEESNSTDISPHFFPLDFGAERYAGEINVIRVEENGITFTILISSGTKPPDDGQGSAGSSKDTAIPLTEGRREGTLQGNEVKWFRFTATARTQYIYLTGLALNSPLFAAVEDESGKQIDMESPQSTTETSRDGVFYWYSSEFVPGKEYFVRIQNTGAFLTPFFLEITDAPKDSGGGIGAPAPGLYKGEEKVSLELNIQKVISYINSPGNPGHYTLVLDAPLEVTAPMDYPLVLNDGSSLTIQHTTGGSGAFFAIGRGGDISLQGSITLQGKSGNDSALVVINAGGVFAMMEGVIIKDNVRGNEWFLEGEGGAVSINGGTFNMYGGEIRWNEARLGGGVYVGNGGSVLLLRSTISGNTATDGGGVYIDGGGTVDLDGGEITGNEATSGGGGVYINHSFGSTPGTLTIKSGKISNNENKNEYQGGGGIIMMSGSIVTMEGGEISGNEAAENGGGVYVWGGEFTIKGGTIAGNKAKDGAGVYVGGGAFNNEGGSILDGIGGNTDPGNTDPGSSAPDIEMVLIPAGTFVMGSPEDEPGHWLETQHSVTLTKGFYMGQCEVTQEQYQAVMTGNANGLSASPSSFTGSPASGEVQAKRPVEWVSWYDVLVFCNRLSLLADLTPVYSINGNTDPANWGTVPTDDNATWNAVSMNSGANGYRLPTEAEWEYACRAGTLTAFNCGTATPDSIDGYAEIVSLLGWYIGNSGDKTHEVGKKSPNAWGLYDMHGNVSEWVWDWYGNYTSDVTDPAGPASGTDRVFRGGSWYAFARGVRSADRGSGTPTFRSFDVGFRLVRSAP